MGGGWGHPLWIEFFADPNVIDSSKPHQWVKHKESCMKTVYLWSLFLIINFLLVPNKTVIFPDTPSLFADPKYK